VTFPRPVTKEPGPRFGISLVVMTLGLIAAVVGVVALVSSFWSVINGPVYPVPATVRVHLGSGDYRVYELDRSGANVGGPPLVDSQTLAVRAPGGSPVPVVETSRNETLTSGSERFDTVVRFHAPTDGIYTLRFRTASPTRVMIEHPLEDLVRDNLAWVGLIIIGGLLAALGFVMVIVGLVRRGSARRRALAASAGPVATPPLPAATAPGAPATPTVTPGPAPTPVPEPTAPDPEPTAAAPAGWFPDPSGTHRLRYWDGQTWTEHIAD
jgi:hypothetical protein